MMNMNHLIFMLNIRGTKLFFDLDGNMLKGGLKSKTARKLVREWVDLHHDDIAQNWELAKRDQELRKIDPLD